MTESHPSHHTLEAILLATLFAVAHTQAPLFFSNQNQYLLHGLSAAGVGELNHDWLANTADPTPAFSWLVANIYTVSGAVGLHAIFFLLLMVYFLSIRSFVQTLPGSPQTRSFRVAFAAIFTALHSALLRVVCVMACDVDYPWFFQSGLAGQYLLGPGLQPSCFGVLIVTGLALVAHGRPILGCATAAFSVAMHMTYALPAGSFVLFVMIFSIRQKQTRSAITAGVVSLLIVMPNFLYTWKTFSPTDPGTFQEATSILATIRIPHHCVVSRWLDAIAGLQILWIAFGLYQMRATKVFPILIAMTGLGVMLTLIQVVTADSTFALAFPWRVSVVLIPVCTAAVMAKLAALDRDRPAVTWLGAISLLLLATGGSILMLERRGYAMDDRELPLYQKIREKSQPDDLYLIPSRIPQVGKGRGVKSATFVTPKWNQIPANLQRFRLLGEHPIYVDFKSVPYRDIEVIEWHRRMKQCENWYDDWKRPGVREELKQAGITKVVTTANRPIYVPFLEQIHADELYLIYRVR